MWRRGRTALAALLVACAAGQAPVPARNSPPQPLPPAPFPGDTTVAIGRPDTRFYSDGSSRTFSLVFDRADPQSLLKFSIDAGTTYPSADPGLYITDTGDLPSSTAFAYSSNTGAGANKGEYVLLVSNSALQYRVTVVAIRAGFFTLTVTQSPFDPIELADGAAANLTVAPGGATLFTYALPPLPPGVPLWEVEFTLTTGPRSLPLSRKDVVMTVAMVPEVALVGLASELDPTGPGRNPAFPAPYVSGIYTGPAPPLNEAAGTKASIVASRDGLGSSQSLLLYFTRERLLVVSVTVGQRSLLPAQQNEDRLVNFAITATRLVATMTCPDTFSFATPAAGTTLMPGELHFFTLPVDVFAMAIAPLILHAEMAVQYGTGDMYMSVNNPFPQIATDGFRSATGCGDCGASASPGLIPFNQSLGACAAYSSAPPPPGSGGGGIATTRSTAVSTRAGPAPRFGPETGYLFIAVRNTGLAAFRYRFQSWLLDDTCGRAGSCDICSSTRSRSPCSWCASGSLAPYCTSQQLALVSPGGATCTATDKLITCPARPEAVCAQFTTCGACRDSPQCGWCGNAEGQGSCTLASPYGASGGPLYGYCDAWIFGPGADCTDACRVHELAKSPCSACAADNGCGFCYDQVSGQCIPGNATGSLSGICPGPELLYGWATVESQCNLTLSNNPIPITPQQPSNVALQTGTTLCTAAFCFERYWVYRASGDMPQNVYVTLNASPPEAAGCVTFTSRRRELPTDTRFDTAGIRLAVPPGTQGMEVGLCESSAVDVYFRAVIRQSCPFQRVNLSLTLWWALGSAVAVSPPQPARTPIEWTCCLEARHYVLNASWPYPVTLSVQALNASGLPLTPGTFVMAARPGLCVDGASTSSHSNASGSQLSLPPSGEDWFVAVYPLSPAPFLVSLNVTATALVPVGNTSVIISYRDRPWDRRLLALLALLALLCCSFPFLYLCCRRRRKEMLLEEAMDIVRDAGISAEDIFRPEDERDPLDSHPLLKVNLRKGDTRGELVVEYAATNGEVIPTARMLSKHAPDAGLPPPLEIPTRRRSPSPASLDGSGLAGQGGSQVGDLPANFRVVIRCPDGSRLECLASGEHVLGRGAGGVRNMKVSREQVGVCVDLNTGEVEILALGKNPAAAFGEGGYQTLSRGTVAPGQDGTKFALTMPERGKELPPLFTVEITPATPHPTARLSNASGGSALPLPPQPTVPLTEERRPAPLRANSRAASVVATEPGSPLPPPPPVPQEPDRKRRRQLSRDASQFVVPLPSDEPAPAPSVSPAGGPLGWGFFGPTTSLPEVVPFVRETVDLRPTPPSERNSLLAAPDWVGMQLRPTPPEQASFQPGRDDASAGSLQRRSSSVSTQRRGSVEGRSQAQEVTPEKWAQQQQPLRTPGSAASAAGGGAGPSSLPFDSPAPAAAPIIFGAGPSGPPSIGAAGPASQGPPSFQPWVSGPGSSGSADNDVSPQRMPLVPPSVPLSPVESVGSAADSSAAMSSPAAGGSALSPAGSAAGPEPSPAGSVAGPHAPATPASPILEEEEEDEKKPPPPVAPPQGMQSAERPVQAESGPARATREGLPPMHPMSPDRVSLRKVSADLQRTSSGPPADLQRSSGDQPRGPSEADSRAPSPDPDQPWTAQSPGVQSPTAGWLPSPSAPLRRGSGRQTTPPLPVPPGSVNLRRVSHTTSGTGAGGGGGAYDDTSIGYRDDASAVLASEGGSIWGDEGFGGDDSSIVADSPATSNAPRGLRRVPSSGSTGPSMGFGTRSADPRPVLRRASSRDREFFGGSQQGSPGLGLGPTLSPTELPEKRAADPNAGKIVVPRLRPTPPRVSSTAQAEVTPPWLEKKQSLRPVSRDPRLPRTSAVSVNEELPADVQEAKKKLRPAASRLLLRTISDTGVPQAPGAPASPWGPKEPRMSTPGSGPRPLGRPPRASPAPSEGRVSSSSAAGPQQTPPQPSPRLPERQSSGGIGGLLSSLNPFKKPQSPREQKTPRGGTPRGGDASRTQTPRDQTPRDGSGKGKQMKSPLCSASKRPSESAAASQQGDPSGSGKRVATSAALTAAAAAARAEAGSSDAGGAGYSRDSSMDIPLGEVIARQQEEARRVAEAAERRRAQEEEDRLRQQEAELQWAEQEAAEQRRRQQEEAEEALARAAEAERLAREQRERDQWEREQQQRQREMEALEREASLRLQREREQQQQMLAQQRAQEQALAQQQLQQQQALAQQLAQQQLAEQRAQEQALAQQQLQQQQWAQEQALAQQQRAQELARQQLAQQQALEQQQLAQAQQRAQEQAQQQQLRALEEQDRVLRQRSAAVDPSYGAAGSSSSAQPQPRTFETDQRPLAQELSFLSGEASFIEEAPLELPADFPPLPPGWEPGITDENILYFYNRDTNESSWTPPGMTPAQLEEILNPNPRGVLSSDAYSNYSDPNAILGEEAPEDAAAAGFGYAYYAPPREMGGAPGGLVPEGASPQNTYAGVSAAYHAAHMARWRFYGGRAFAATPSPLSSRTGSRTESEEEDDDDDVGMSANDQARRAATQRMLTDLNTRLNQQSDNVSETGSRSSRGTTRSRNRTPPSSRRGGGWGGGGRGGPGQQPPPGYL